MSIQHTVKQHRAAKFFVFPMLGMAREVQCSTSSRRGEKNGSSNSMHLLGGDETLED
jgi:hypothetical protein